jgi:ATP-dependent RNA helicase DeaD
VDETRTPEETASAPIDQEAVEREKRLAARAANAALEDADPDDLVEPEDALPEVKLEQLPEVLQQAAARAGWAGLMPVQARALPYMLAKRDLMIQSRTGSGKTGAFLLPIIERIDLSDKRCQALVLVPTRELARQVMSEAELLAGDSDFRAVAVYGGVGYGPQIEAFEAGVPLVVGTPGRVLDHLLKRTLTLDGLRMLVLDEADRMLSMGFYPDMVQLKQYLPESYNGYMFSATFPNVVKSLAGEFLDQPEFLSLSKDKVHIASTEHVVYDVPAMDKDRALMRLIEIENPSSAIIFCNTKSDTRYVATVLKRFGYDADELSSDLSQNAREEVLQKVRDGKLRFLVATDVAARGIDIFELSHVFQYGPPQDPESYVHRAGRTSRAGASGEAVTLVSGLERIELQNIGKRFEIDMQEREAPKQEEVEAIVSQRVTVLLEAKLRERNVLQKERMRRFVPLAKSLGESDDEVKLLAMLLDDYYQKSLHEPPGGIAPVRTETSSKPRQSGGGGFGGGRGRGGGGRGGGGGGRGGGGRGGRRR